MSLPEAFFIGSSTDLFTLPGVVVTDASGLFAPGTRRGSDIAVPYADGETVVDGLPFAAYDFEIGVALLPDEADGDDPGTLHLRRAQMISNLRGIAAVIQAEWPQGYGTGKRRLSKAPSGYDEHTATIRYREGLAIEEINAVTGETRLGFRNATGYWLNGTTPVWP